MRNRSACLAAAAFLLAAVGCESGDAESPTAPRVTTTVAPPTVTAPASDATAGEEAAARRPDVLLLIADTLRADRLPAYGFEYGKTPTLDRLTRDAVVFDRAVAASAATMPSHASMFTSRFVRQHSVGYNNGNTMLADEKTIAQHFQEAGYATAGFIGNVMMLDRLTGFARGFEVYDDRLPQPEKNRPEFFEREAPQTTQRAIAWLKKRAGDRPVFLLVHYQDPHGPYTPPERVLRGISLPAPEEEPRLPVNETQSGYGGIPAYQALEGLDRQSQYESRYLAEILYMDRWMGLLLDAFEEHRPDAGHVVVFTSDHGESLGEEGHWFEHGHTSMPDLAHVPFLLRAPEVPAGRRSEPVSHVDILPTLLDLAGLPVPADAVGVALGPYLRENERLPARELYCDLGLETGIYDDDGITRIRFSSFEAADAGNTRDADVSRWDWTPGGPPVARDSEAEVGAAAAAYLADVKTPRVLTAAPDPKHVERMRALGYIEPEDPAD